MAVDNLNYYSSWLPAWQQTDKYTSQPWCLKSKNLDIFSSSKSVKATAWSEPSAWASDIIKQDGDLILKTDGKVYEMVGWVETLFVDPSVNFPSYKVSYNGSKWTYEDAQWGTVQDMVVKYEWAEWKSFVVFTDRASYTYSKVKYTPAKSFSDMSNLTLDDQVWVNGYKFTKTNTTSSSGSISISLDNVPFAKFKIRLYAYEPSSTSCTISLDTVKMYEYRYYYDWEMEAIVPEGLRTTYDLPFSWTITDWFDIEIPTMPTYLGRKTLQLNFKFTTRAGDSWYSWNNWELYVDMNWWFVANRVAVFEDWNSDWDFNDYYSYLPITDRKLVDVGEYYWMPALSFQTLYNWDWVWAEIIWEKKTRYDFVQYMWWANDPAMDVVSMIAWNEQIYMIGNMNWNWYIFPCDLSWGRWTPYIAYGCTFKWATNIDYLLYLVWENRWVSTLWVFNQQELVPLVWGNKESWITDLVDSDEQYNFDWKIVNYRKNLILTTSDGRIFRYGQTYWGKWWTFIHDLKPSEHDSLTIDSVKAYWNDLTINYTVVDTIEWSSVTTHWAIIYQDDIAEKNYNTEWMAEYPIQLWNHLLEKEESDLYASYILPSADTSLEFWGMANHYHFWTFTSEDDATLDPAESYKIAWATWDYALKFVERNENQYTFRLEGDLPIQTTNEMKITDSEDTVVINYSDFNHFRKIWEITTDKYCEWEFRFHNLNNQLELPKSHSLQIMVKGKGTVNYTPELFALDLVANQRDRW